MEITIAVLGLLLLVSNLIWLKAWQERSTTPFENHMRDFARQSDKDHVKSLNKAIDTLVLVVLQTNFISGTERMARGIISAALSGDKDRVIDLIRKGQGRG